MKILTAMNIKKLVCFFALLAFCCTHFFNGNLFAKDETGDSGSNNKNGQDQIMVCDDREVGGADHRTHYKRHIFNLQFETGHEYSGSATASGAELSGKQSYTNLILSCCIRAIFEKTCDFSLDDVNCDKYIDRKRGRPYEHSKHKM